MFVFKSGLRSVRERDPERHRLSRAARTAVPVAAGLTLVLSLPNAAFAAPGGLDTTFGTGGKVTTGFGSTVEEANAVAVQTDGRIVAAGHSSAAGTDDFTLARYNTNGSLDGTFGNGGKVVTDIAGGSDVAYGVALQRDGKIVTVGRSEIPDGGVGWFTLARYNTNGSLDATFGNGGTAVVDFGTGGADEADAVVVQSDGRIVAAGQTAGEFALARLNTNGSLDTGFGSGGKVVTDINNGANGINGVALQSDGRIVAAGHTGDSAGNYNFALARYNTNGSLDTGFGTGGKVVTDFGGFDWANGIVVQSDGKLVAAGQKSGDFALARYNTNGTLDTGFGTGGKVVTDFGISEIAYGLVLQPDGRLVAAGDSNGDFALARYNTNGTLDAGFGTGGKVTTDFGGTDQASAIALQTDGKIVAAGVGTADGHFALARYQP